MSDQTTEPDANKATTERPFRCRVKFNPMRWVHLSGGEMHDHRVWGSLLEDPDGMVDDGPEAAAPEDTAVQAKTDAPAAATQAQAGTGEKSQAQAADTTAATDASAPAAKAKS